jgi:alkanesulfonate monooxygenase SsuD/methylene tetrahydromethanopterin reductase-like flavin-dependent oxidoreductase (luciferase family)
MERSREVIVEAAVRADQLGFEAVVVPEGWGFDASVVLAEIALRTERIHLVSGIMSVWGRSPATMAMAAATLSDLSGGRFSIGLGSSTPILAERFHGQPFTAPSARLDHTAAVVRSLLDGDAAPSTDGTAGLRLSSLPSAPVPLWIAGLGPRSVDVARRRADVWFPALVPLEHLAKVADDLLGPASSRPAVACGPLIAPGPDRSAREAASRGLVGWYLTGMGRLYADQVAACGYSSEVEAVRRANTRPRPCAVEWPDAAEPLAAQLMLTGSDESIRDRLAAWHASADIVSIVVGPGSSDEVVALVELLAPRRSAMEEDAKGSSPGLVSRRAAEGVGTAGLVG